MGIEVEKLHLEMRNKKILTNICLSISAGKLTAITGSNGAGKTSLLRVMAGLNKKTSGTIKINGDDRLLENIEKRSKLISWGPERVQIPFSYTVKDIVSMGLYPWSSTDVFPGIPASIVVNDLLRSLDLEKFKDQPMETLSSGETRVVNFARSIVGKQQMILLDEPTANLDRGNSQKIYKKLRQLTEEGKAVCIATHDVDLVRSVADVAIKLESGRIVATTQTHGQRKNKADTDQ